MNLMLLEQQLRFEIVDLQAHTAQAVFREKVNVSIGTPIARAIQDRLHTLQGFVIFLSCLRLLPRQRFAPFMEMGGRRNFLILFHRSSFLTASGERCRSKSLWSGLEQRFL